MNGRLLCGKYLGIVLFVLLVPSVSVLAEGMDTPRDGDLLGVNTITTKQSLGHGATLYHISDVVYDEALNAGVLKSNMRLSLGDAALAKGRLPRILSKVPMDQVTIVTVYFSQKKISDLKFLNACTSLHTVFLTGRGIRFNELLALPRKKQIHSLYFARIHTTPLDYGVLRAFERLNYIQIDYSKVYPQFFDALCDMDFNGWVVFIGCKLPAKLQKAAEHWENACHGSFSPACIPED